MQKANDLGVKFIETSAKVGINVKQLFTQIAETLIQTGMAFDKENSESKGGKFAIAEVVTPGSQPKAASSSSCASC